MSEGFERGVETFADASPGRKRVRVYFAIAVLFGLLAGFVGKRMAERPARVEMSAFARAVDLSPLGGVAVHTEGRLKSFDSFAHSMVRYVSGPHELFGQAQGFTYFDMMLRPERYRSSDVVFVKNKPIRALIAQRLDGREGVPPERLAHFMRTGLISPEVLTTDPAVHELMSRLRRDAMKAKHVEQVETGLGVMSSETLLGALRVIPPPPGPGSDKAAWASLAEAEGEGAGALPGVPEATTAAVRAGWEKVRTGWRVEDSAAVNDGIAALAAALPTINAEVYPARPRLSWESRYFAMGNMTWVWWVYLAGTMSLLMGVVYRWRAAHWIGLGLFLGAFGLHTTAVALRWYVSGRWPNANMFEAVTTAAWFGGVAALVLEPLARRAGMRGLFLLGSSAASMTALMAAHFLPLQLNPAIGNKMPVLHDVWLYIHTNVIIFSYVLIAMASVTAGMYLLGRLGGGGAAYAKAGGGGALVGLGGERRRVPLGEVLDGATMVLMESSFILLWAGIVMGAIWADHSWGRPWGWDPKEVFALNTFVIFAILVHVRLKVRDKGLWTAWLAVAGCAVMIFNWTVINFVITGLHSYA